MLFVRTYAFLHIKRPPELRILNIRGLISVINLFLLVKEHLAIQASHKQWLHKAIGVILYLLHTNTIAIAVLVLGFCHTVPTNISVSAIPRLSLTYVFTS